MVKAKTLPILLMLHRNSENPCEGLSAVRCRRKGIRSPRDIKEGGMGAQEAAVVKDPKGREVP